MDSNTLKAKSWLEGVKEDKLYNPLVTYYFINKTLNMSQGKVAVQTARAAQVMLYREIERSKELTEIIRSENKGCLVLDDMSSAELSLNELFHDDFMHGNKSITLKANQSQMDRMLSGDLSKELLKIGARTYPVYDIGATEVETNSLTVIALTPTLKSKIEYFTKKFQLY